EDGIQYFNVTGVKTCALTIFGFSKVTGSKDIRKFFEELEEAADENLQALSKILHEDNLPVPKSLETEVTTSKDSPFSDKLMLYQIGIASCMVKCMLINRY